jgi:hypothetical protein
MTESQSAQSSELQDGEALEFITFDKQKGTTTYFDLF